MFLLPVQNAPRIKPQNSGNYSNDDVSEIEARLKQNADIRKCLESSILTILMSWEETFFLYFSKEKEGLRKL